MQRHMRLLLLVAVPLLAAGGITHGTTSAYGCIDGVRPCPSAPGSPPAFSTSVLVSVYFAAQQRGIATGNFVPLSTLFTPRATVTMSDAEGRPATATGPAQIERLYRRRFAGRAKMQWVQDAMHRLSPTLILTYEHEAGPHLRNPEHILCLFVIQGGKIVRLDETTYAGG
jgi:hypothetical protein